MVQPQHFLFRQANDLGVALNKFRHALQQTRKMQATQFESRGRQVGLGPQRRAKRRQLCFQLRVEGEQLLQGMDVGTDPAWCKKYTVDLLISIGNSL